MSKIKILVEIEKRTYELLKDKPDNIAEEIIANGTPYPQGKWIDDGPAIWKCSCCGYGVNRWNNTPFCPNCGAKMSISEGKDV